MSCPSAGGLPPTVAPTLVWSSLGSLADGVPVPDVAIPLFCCVCLPPHSCAPPSYCEHALVSPQCRRTAALTKQFLHKAACRSRPSSNSFALLRSYRASPSVWLSPRALAPGAPLLMTGSLLRALVTRNRWLLARPAARAADLALPAGSRWFRAGRSRPFLERTCHADRLVLGLSGSSRHWSRSALVSADSALVALGPFLSALVTRTGWYSARPVARATGLAQRWSSLCALVALLSLLVARP